MADDAPLVGSASDVRGLDRPEDGEILHLYELWLAKRGQRRLPSRAAFDPAEFPRLLPHVMLVDVLPPPDFYRVRLSGEAVNQFYGRNIAGRYPREYLSPEAVAVFGAMAQKMAAERLPLCRIGRAYWQVDKSYKRFESCLLPLGADGQTVDMILVAIKFGG